MHLVDDALVQGRDGWPAELRLRQQPALPVVALAHHAIAYLELRRKAQRLNDEINILREAAQPVEGGDQLYGDPAFARIHVAPQELIAAEILCGEVVVHLVDDALVQGRARRVCDHIRRRVGRLRQLRAWQSIVPLQLAAHRGPVRLEDEKPDHGQDDDASGDGP